MKLGISGHVTKAFITSPLTPLLLLASLALGALALYLLPREEEPQISVPMVDIMVRADGLKAEDVLELVTEPLEDIVKSIDGVEHVYSQSLDDRVAMAVRFKVGHDADAAIVRVHSEIRGNMNRIPLGIPEPLIVGRGIEDVAVLVVTLAAKPGNPARLTDAALYNLAEELQHELTRQSDVGLTYIVGGRPAQIRIEPDPERLALEGITLNQLVEKLENANRAFLSGSVRQSGGIMPVIAGETLRGSADVELLLLTSHAGCPVYLKDVARVVIDGRPDEHRVWHLTPDGQGKLRGELAVSLAIGKRPGANAVDITDGSIERLQRITERKLPVGVDLIITRNYGDTAQEKADELLLHLLSATVSIVVLLTLFLGWREGMVVMFVVPTTILLTFLAAWMMGYTINRVSMFALIFAIGILVDDAIVVVENIVRHWRANGGDGAVSVAIKAVAEVGNPTIIATFTIITALLPMMFVSGLMGPYMNPIPAIASAAMFLSLLMALTVTPWLMMKFRRGLNSQTGVTTEEHGGILGRMFLLAGRPLLQGRRRSGLFLAIVGVATLASFLLFYSQDVVVKLLPFDNKSELSVVVDLPEGAALEDTERVLRAAADAVASLPELLHIQAYAGTAAPFNFNGLVRHSYMRTDPNLGELQLNLLAKDDRDRSSHDIALDIRRRLGRLETPAGSNIKVIEVPPGPPVLATLLAEIYGPDAETRRAVAAELRGIFDGIDFIVDVDDSFGTPGKRLRLAIDRESLEFHRVEEAELYDTIATLLRGRSLGYSHRGAGAEPIEIAIGLPKSARYLSQRLLTTPVPTREDKLVELGELVKVGWDTASFPIFRRDGNHAEMVTAELAGRFEAPIYGMLAVQEAIDKHDWGGLPRPKVALHGQPADDEKPVLLWDGEWEITYVTFRDMGAAFMVAMVGIYLLVVIQFGGFKLPLLVLVPIPLTLVGIVGGHWLLSAPFTATSMIGFIALAGIIVRNSILLIDFIRQRRSQGAALRDALLAAGAIRFKPIFLTAVTAMIGAAFILTDPIFQGLAISLLFGLLSSTLLTVLVIPAIYIIMRDDGVVAGGR
ncbi:MAG: efflux RND transporter permease subunit [Alphaproteobacteria bacterium]|jgi:multidrug efflux pump subunit AcrB|nr:efflux RND transporter permease subunit [Alphaproteobacteria bacterium]